MAQYSITETKEQLSELIDRAREGEEITITSQGKPVATLNPIVAAPKRITPEGIQWLIDHRVGTTMPKEDAGTLVSRMRDEDWER